MWPLCAGNTRERKLSGCGRLSLNSVRISNTRSSDAMSCHVKSGWNFYSIKHLISCTSNITSRFAEISNVLIERQLIEVVVEDTFAITCRFNKALKAIDVTSFTTWASFSSSLLLVSSPSSTTLFPFSLSLWQNLKKRLLAWCSGARAPPPP